MSAEYERMLEGYMDIVEGAMLLGCSDSYMRRHSVGGIEPRIKFVKIAGKIRFKVRDLEDFIASQNTETPVIEDAA